MGFSFKSVFGEYRDTTRISFLKCVIFLNKKENTFVSYFQLRVKIFQTATGTQYKSRCFVLQLAFEHSFNIYCYCVQILIILREDFDDLSENNNI